MLGFLKFWPFLAIILNLWFCAAFMKNPYGVGRSKKGGYIYNYYALLFLLAAVMTIFGVCINYFVNSKGTVPIYLVYWPALSILEPLLILAGSIFGKKPAITPKELGKFLLFRPTSSTQQLNVAAVPYYQNTETTISNNYPNKPSGNKPFIAVGIVTLSTTLICGALIYGEFQNCNTLDILFGISGCQNEITELFNPVSTVSYSPDGTRLAIGGSHGFLQIVNLQNTDEHQNLSGVGDFIDTATFSSDSSLLASADSDGLVGIWRVADGSAIQKLKIPRDNWVSDVNFAFSPDNTLLAIGSGNKGITIWRIADGSLIHSFTTTDNAVTFTPDGKQLLLQSTDGSNNIVFWNIADWSVAKTMPTHAGFLAFGQNGTQLIVSNRDGIQVWDIASQKILHQLPLQSIRADKVYKGATVVLVKADDFFEGNIKVEEWNINSGKQSWEVELPTNNFETTESFAPDGKNIAFTNTFQSIQIWKFRP